MLAPRHPLVAGCLVLLAVALLLSATGWENSAHRPTTLTTSPSPWHHPHRSSGAPVTTAAAAWLSAVYNVREHPSCTAEAILRRNALAESSTLNGGAAADPSLEPLALFDRYDRRRWNCYKHGGHYNPGYPRAVVVPPLPPLAARGLGSTELIATSVEAFVQPALLEAIFAYHKARDTHDDDLQRITPRRRKLAPVRYVLRDVVWHAGKLWTCHAQELRRILDVPESESTVTLPLAGVFSMVTGNWPQSVATGSLELVPPPPAWHSALCSGNASSQRRTAASMRVVDVAYWQAPTDYISTYHVFVEVLMNMHHALWFTDRSMGRHRHRPPFRDEPREVVILSSRPTYSRYGFNAKSCRYGPAACLGTAWASAAKAIIDDASHRPVKLGPAELDRAENDWIVGLRGDPAEAQRPPLLIKEAVVGYPTQCEPLWGPDAVMFDRAARFGLRTLLSNRDYLVCQRALWDFRRVLLVGAGVSGRDDASGVAAYAPPSVLWVSRRGDWARWVTNEDTVIDAINTHLQRRYGDSRRRYVVSATLKQYGNLSAQVRLVHGATIYITNHGANLIPVMYLRPNAGFISLDVDTPGFLPFATAPSWLHWRRLTVGRVCNRRLSATCAKRHAGPNNDDNIVTASQQERLLRALDAILAAQQASPLLRPLPDDRTDEDEAAVGV